MPSGYDLNAGRIHVFPNKARLSFNIHLRVIPGDVNDNSCFQVFTSFPNRFMPVPHGLKTIKPFTPAPGMKGCTQFSWPLLFHKITGPFTRGQVFL
jgi:hypothetical protein